MTSAYWRSTEPELPNRERKAAGPLTSRHGKPDATRVYPCLLTLPQGPTVWRSGRYGGNVGVHTGDKRLTWQTTWPAPTDAQRSRSYQIENERPRDPWLASRLDATNTDKPAWETWRHSSLPMPANITTGGNIAHTHINWPTW